MNRTARESLAIALRKLEKQQERIADLEHQLCSFTLLRYTQQEPAIEGYYWRRRVDDKRSHWRMVKIPSRRSRLVEPWMPHEYYGPLPEPPENYE